MGATYTNIVLRTADRARVADFLETRGKPAYVGPARDGYTIVFDSAADDDPNTNGVLAEELSGALGCAAIGWIVYDSDITAYTLCERGQVIDRYDSRPGYRDGDARPPEGGDAALLARAIGGPAANEAEVDRILRIPGDKEEYLFEEARHSELVEALGLPDYGVGLGYHYVYQGDAEEIGDELEHVGAPADDEAGGGGGLPAGLRQAVSALGIDLEGLMGAARNPLAAMSQMGELQRQMTALLANPAGRYWTAVIFNRPDEILEMFAGEPRINAPGARRVESAADLDGFLADTHAWMKSGDDAMQARMMAQMGVPAGMAPPVMASYIPIAVTEMRARTVAEGTLMFMRGGMPLQLPVATVWEAAPEGGVGTLRVYHTLWLMQGTHTVRPPVLPPHPGIHPPDVVGQYQAALAAGDVEAVVATFDPAGHAREPAGAQYLHAGAEGLRRFYSALFANGGGIPLQHCALTDDGTRCAVEYVVTRWGTTELPPQAGIAVYERGPSGKLVSARIYDDVDPPVPTG
jgi:hypothetical protein